MRPCKRVFVLCVLLNSFFAPAQKKGVMSVYLIGGQSNATGQGYVRNLTPDQVIDTTVLIFHSGRPHLDGGDKPFDWHALQQASESPDRFGPELGFGMRIRQLFPGENIALIKHAHSGTNLFDQWRPGTVNDTASGGEQFKIFTATVDSGLMGLKRMGYTPVIKAMLWQQGESDADAKETALRYGQNLRRFIERVREQCHSPRLLFVYGYVMPPPVVRAGREEVRRAQKELDETSGSARAIKGAHVVETDDLQQRATDKDTPYPTDRLHFGTSGTWNLGVRMADKVYAYKKRLPSK